MYHRPSGCQLTLKTLLPCHAIMSPVRALQGPIFFPNFPFFIQTLQYHVYTCDNPLTLSAFGSVGCLLALKALCHASHSKVMGSKPSKTISFLQTSFFHVFL